MIRKKIKKNQILLVGLLIGVLMPFGFVQAQTCPSITTVDGTTVTFSGELTDMGGDIVTYVWFEYGKTRSLGEKTPEQSLTRTGLYCANVHGLSPDTTYYYRAGARNEGGTSHGEIRSFTTAEQVTEDLQVRKTIRNLSKGTHFAKSVLAEPQEVLVFRIMVRAEDKAVQNVIVKDTLPSGIIYRGDLRINDVSTTGNILTGLNIGNLSANQEKVITFRGDVAEPASFAFGQTKLTNSVLVSSDNISRSDTADIIVTRTAVEGVVTQIPTGLTDNLLFDSLLIPLTIALLIVWLFRARILRFEEWLDSGKKRYQNYKSEKSLKMKVAKIKTEEFLKRKLF